MYETTLRVKREITPNLIYFQFDRPEDFSFQAGQFTRLGVMGEDGPMMRAYSIASTPTDPFIAFYISIVPNGQVTPRLAQLEVGQTALLDEVVQGSLLPSRIPGGETLWMIATGTGVAPFLSQLRDPMTWQQWKDIVLVHSVRTLEEARLTRELLEADLPGELTLVIATTREDQPEDQKGDLSGRVPNLLENGDLESHVGKIIAAQTSRVMLCGNPQFIESMREVFKARQMVTPRMGNPGQYIVENFW